VVTGGVLAVLAWKDVSRVRDELGQVQDTLVTASQNAAALQTDGGRTDLVRRLDLAAEAVQASRRRLVASPALSVLGSVPGLRAQRSGLLQLVDDATAGARAARDMVEGVDAVADRSRLQGGTIPLDGLSTLMSEVRTGGAVLGGLRRDDEGLIGPLADARRQFDEVVVSGADRLGRAGELLGASLRLFGAESPRRYFVAFQNNAEMRDQGMVLSFGILRFTGGAFALERTGSVGELPLDRPAPTAVPPGTQEVFGALAPTQTWQSVNATADFAFTGQAIADMYAQATGSQIDGVIALDVPALAGLLRVVGPVTVEGLAEPITDGNVARIVLKDFYEGIQTEAQHAARRERLAEVVRAVLTRVTQVTVDPVALGRELGRAAGGGHLRLWSSDPGEEQVFERNGLGGGPAVELPDRTFHVAVQNRTATKLDYYIKTRVLQDVRLTESGDAQVRTTVILENTVPPDAPRSYAIGPDTQMSRPGEYRAWLLLWAPAGSRQPGAVEESGLQLAQHVLFVNPGETRELTFVETVIPDAVRNGELRLRLVPQARLEPVPLEVKLRAEGWQVEGAPSWSGPWDSVRTLAWKVRR
jgi:hypothetical protein